MVIQIKNRTAVGKDLIFLSVAQTFMWGAIVYSEWGVPTETYLQVMMYSSFVTGLVGMFLASELFSGTDYMLRQSSYTPPNPEEWETEDEYDFAEWTKMRAANMRGYIWEVICFSTFSAFLYNWGWGKYANHTDCMETMLGALLGFPMLAACYLGSIPALVRGLRLSQDLKKLKARIVPKKVVKRRNQIIEYMKSQVETEKPKETWVDYVIGFFCAAIAFVINMAMVWYQTEIDHYSRYLFGSIVIAAYAIYKLTKRRATTRGMWMFCFLGAYIVTALSQVYSTYIENNPTLNFLWLVGCVLALIGLPAAIEGYQSGKKDDETKR